MEGMTLNEASAKYGYSPDHLRVLIYRKELKAKKIGNTWTVTEGAMKDLMEAKGKG